jgi:hypothetical protein
MSRGDRITSFPEYRRAALETAPDQSPRKHLQQGALGLPGEWREYREVRGSGELSEKAIDELGDCFWYAALVAEGCRQISGDRLLRNEPDSAILTPHFRRLSGAVEGYCYQEKADALETIDEELSAIVWLLHQETCGEAPTVWRYNLVKLSGRYPDGWEAGGGQREGGNLHD